MKQEAYHQLVKPELVKTVSGLALVARVIVDGYLSGLQHSRSVGSGMEFSQFRNYEQGDDLRLLDWKMVARSGRYYIKQSDIETNIAVKFIVDASTSMLHKEDKFSKMEYARILVATLAYLSQKQGDAIGLFALNDKKLHSVYSKVQKQHYNRLLQGLIDIENKGRWPENPNASKSLHDRNHKELVFFITDLYEHQEELTAFIKRLKTPRNEVVVLHLMGKNELEFNYKGTVTFEDLETGAKRKIDAKEAKKQYLSALNAAIKKNKNTLLTHNIGYHMFRLDEHIGEALQAFLKQRNRLL
ncbi:DUF58 domain-containing protein [Aquimarina sp. MMG016]|uniref:DUF58 domain-containing protein n=1 Tax=Aquimarina sp. MMG016 TaxID=2822690 RepID=UPI001B3A5A38|nr:DUF58 domain-containing protein [Aquimarina sp. MMG016]MBQ4821685.1 DUF58 domain-containing protein [Aquimarina sp. MMG016]